MMSWASFLITVKLLSGLHDVGGIVGEVLLCLYVERGAVDQEGFESPVEQNYKDKYDHFFLLALSC